MVASDAWAELNAENPALPSWLRPSVEALARAPDPEAARTAASRVVLAAGRDALESRVREAPERMAWLLWALCGVAPYFAPMLCRRPGWLLSLLDDPLERPRDRKTLERTLDEALAAGAKAGDDPGAVLRRFKYYELARITVFDCNDELVPIERSARTLLALSQLADLLLDRALGAAAAAFAERFGPPRWRDTEGNQASLAFAVLGLGKLGSEELNYSSDVDLVYVFEAPKVELAYGHVEDGYAELPPPEYFSRLAQRFGGLVSSVTDEGFLYRIDLDLRPEGNLGPLVVSDEALATYYEVRAATWEMASFMKARPVAGDSDFGWYAIRTVDPMIYRSTMDYAAVDGIRALKEKIEAAHGGGPGTFDVKIDSGGIRDVEFIAQAMQLLHGGRIEQVRAKGTRDALERLRDVRILSRERVERLLLAYLFLRRLENRLQMVDERQVHRLDQKPDTLARFARAMGFAGPEGTERFVEQLEEHRAHILEVFEAFFFEEGSDRIFVLFARHVPRLLAMDGSRRMLEDLAAQFASAIDSGSDPQRALNNLDRFVSAVSGGRFYFELLLDRPELVPRLSALFAGSNYLSSILATHPGLIEPVFHDPNLLLLDREQLEADFDHIAGECQHGPDDDEGILCALRLFFYRQILNVGLLAMGRKIERWQAEEALTQIAEVCLGRALAGARSWLVRRRPAMAPIAEATRFVVVGMGKLASSELTYGSDLDLIFLFDVREHAGGQPVEAVDAQECATRLAQRLMSMLQTHTAQGTCYEVDARLRPSGNQGTLVTSLASFRRYHEGQAEIWERQILLRARPVAGDAELGEAFERLRLSIVTQPVPADARARIHHIRQRMETELAAETASRHDFKRGRGGMLDVETIVQVLQLEQGREHPELLAPRPLAEVLPRLAEKGALPAAQATALLEGWDFLQELNVHLRIVENRSISDLDEERGDLEGLARAMGYATAAGRDVRRQLLRDYREHTERIRALYCEVFSVPPSGDDRRSGGW